jgi:carbamoyl-phosphate synthase large subunit
MRPVYKRVDTCAAEFASSTAYMYSTYDEECEAAPATRRRSWSSAAGRTASARASSSTTAACTRPSRMREDGYETIMVNCNPETVSTDYDTSDRLYFEP